MMTQGKFLWAMKVWVNRMSWFRRGSEAEDKIVADTGEMLIEGLVNADEVNVVKSQHDRNRREQMTVEEVLEMHREIDLRKFGWGRN